MNRLSPDKLKELAEKWLNGTILPEERKLLNDWYNHEQEYPVEWKLEDVGERQLEERLFTNLSKEISLKKRVPVLKRRITLLASAAVVIFCSVGVFLSLSKADKGKKLVYKPYKGEVLPGSNKATLTLANGLKIALNDVSKGEIAYQEGVKITKAAEGKLLYMPVKGASSPLSEGTSLEKKARIEAFNTIEIPKGGQYSLVLPDGTRVWLNSASSLRYPALFAGKERNVELTGEAYFEVAKDPEKPFKVSAGGTVVQVLGTHFNVSAYPDDEYVATTLLEGSVTMSRSNLKENVAVRLKPGQQAIAQHTGEQIMVRAVDTDNAVAWKNGYFKFNNEDIRSIMKRVSRWYNIKVVYQGNMNDKIYGGTFSRSKSLADLLHNLELTGTIHFKVEGAYTGKSNSNEYGERRIVVMP